MFRSSFNQRNRSHDLLVRCNFAIVIILTISSTALTAYILNFIVNSSHRKVINDTIQLFPPTQGSKSKLVDNNDDDIIPQSSEVISSHHSNTNDNMQILPPARPLIERLKLHEIGAVYNQNSLTFLDENFKNKSQHIDSIRLYPFKDNSFVSSNEWRPIVEVKDSVGIGKKVHPDVILSEGMKKFKQRLSNMSKIELLKLLKIVQERIDMSVLSLKKRNADKFESEPTKMPSTLKQHVGGKEQYVVTRSEKMRQLMDNLEKIELIAPELDENKLNKITKLENERSIVRIVKPDLIEAVTKKPSLSMVKRRDTLNALSGSTSWRNEMIASLQPVEVGWPQQPQQEVTVEDWPTVQPISTVRPKKRKKKKKVVITTTTTTPAPVIIEYTSTIPPSPPAPPAAFEEVWIEEEEDIVRPPRRKLKKYKKKTSQAPETTTTSTSTTTTTTTTTTRPPTTTTAPEVITEDWPNDDPWPTQPSTKAPTTIETWPEKQEVPEQQGKWPEEEWLNAVRDNVQNQYNILYI